MGQRSRWRIRQEVAARITLGQHITLQICGIGWVIVRPVRSLKSAATTSRHHIPSDGSADSRSGAEPFAVAVKNGISFMSRPRTAMSEWVVHCEVNQRHMRRSHPTRDAALKDACSQLLQGHAVNRIVGPQKTITGERVRDWCARHRP
jgi:hypothetical protein